MDTMSHVEPPSPHWICPISGSIMQDPVSLPSGHLFDRTSLEKWFASSGTHKCPVTRCVLDPSTDLKAETAVKDSIQAWLSTQTDATAAHARKQCTAESGEDATNKLADVSAEELLWHLLAAEAAPQQLQLLQELSNRVSGCLLGTPVGGSGAPGTVMSQLLLAGALDQLAHLLLRTHSCAVQVQIHSHGVIVGFPPHGSTTVHLRCTATVHVAYAVEDSCCFCGKCRAKLAWCVNASQQQHMATCSVTLTASHEHKAPLLSKPLNLQVAAANLLSQLTTFPGAPQILRSTLLYMAAMPRGLALKGEKCGSKDVAVLKQLVTLLRHEDSDISIRACWLLWLLSPLPGVRDKLVSDTGVLHVVHHLFAAQPLHRKTVHSPDPAAAASTPSVMHQPNHLQPHTPQQRGNSQQPSIVQQPCSVQQQPGSLPCVNANDPCCLVCDDCLSSRHSSPSTPRSPSCAACGGYDTATTPGTCTSTVRDSPTIIPAEHPVTASERSSTIMAVQHRPEACLDIMEQHVATDEKQPLAPHVAHLIAPQASHPSAPSAWPPSPASVQGAPDHVGLERGTQDLTSPQPDCLQDPNHVPRATAALRQAAAPSGSRAGSTPLLTRLASFTAALRRKPPQSVSAEQSVESNGEAPSMQGTAEAPGGPVRSCITPAAASLQCCATCTQCSRGLQNLAGPLQGLNPAATTEDQSAAALGRSQSELCHTTRGVQGDGRKDSRAFEVQGCWADRNRRQVAACHLLRSLSLSATGVRVMQESGCVALLLMVMHTAHGPNEAALRISASSALANMLAMLSKKLPEKAGLGGALGGLLRRMGSGSALRPKSADRFATVHAIVGGLAADDGLLAVLADMLQQCATTACSSAQALGLQAGHGKEACPDTEQQVPPQVLQQLHSPGGWPDSEDVVCASSTMAAHAAASLLSALLFWGPSSEQPEAPVQDMREGAEGLECTLSMHHQACLQAAVTLLDHDNKGLAAAALRIAWAVACTPAQGLKNWLAYNGGLEAAGKLLSKHASRPENAEVVSKLLLIMMGMASPKTIRLYVSPNVSKGLLAALDGVHDEACFAVACRLLHQLLQLDAGVASCLTYDHASMLRKLGRLLEAFHEGQPCSCQHACAELLLQLAKMDDTRDLIIKVGLAHVVVDTLQLCTSMQHPQYQSSSLAALCIKTLRALAMGGPGARHHVMEACKDDRQLLALLEKTTSQPPVPEKGSSSKSTGAAVAAAGN